MLYFAGLAFWKCGSRKIYAVRVISNTRAPLKRSAKSKAKANCTSYYDISDNSDEEFTPKRSRGVNHGDIRQMVNSQISEVKAMVYDILKVNQTLSLPLGVHLQNMSCNTYDAPNNCNKMLQYLAWL